MERCLPDILVIQETKLTSDFKTESFLISNYQKPIRLKRQEIGGGLMLFLRKGVICNRVSIFESLAIECICSDLTSCKKRWVIFSIHRPPDVSNLELLFKELSSSREINIDTHDVRHYGHTKLNSMCHVLNYQI